jgi:hypothetical protein
MRLQGERPIAVITSIEGVIKQELKKRTVSVEYAVTGNKLPRVPIESEIRKSRHAIGSALIPVVQEYLSTPAVETDTNSPLPDFSEHFEALCGLLRAYAKVAGKNADWAERIIEVWKHTIKPSDVGEDQSELEAILEQVLRTAESEGRIPNPYPMQISKMVWKGVPGDLFVTTCGNLSISLNKENASKIALPQDPSGLGRRLRSAEFDSLVVLDEKSAPEIPELKRGAGARKIGIFRPAT